MKYRLLDWLACPGCGGPDLELESLRVDREVPPREVLDGILSCDSCGRAYPVVDGIPRLLPDSWEEYRRRLSVYRLMELRPSAARDQEVRAFRERNGSTRQSFSFEWLRYQVTEFAENAQFFRLSTGLGREELRGKLVLDAGCGMGRFLEVAASQGAEVVGLDLSRSVERAWRETRHRANVHLVQADIMKPPFQKEVFDVVYSIGVLHHTSDTRLAFRSLCPLLRPGGKVAIWVYRSIQPEIEVGLHKRAFALLSEWVSDGIRLITTRMPHRLLHYLCYSAVPLGWLRRNISLNPVLKYLLWPLLLPPVSDHPDWRVRLCDTFDWLSPKYQWKHTSREVLGWFEAEGLREIRTLEKPVSVTGVKPAPRSVEAIADSRGLSYALQQN